MRPTRTETIALRASLDKSGADRHGARLVGTCYRDAIKTLREGDTLHIDYEFRLEYFGEVERHLKLYETLLADPSVVVNADFEEMEHGHSLLLSLVESITRIRDAIDRKRAAEDRGPARENGFTPFTERQEAYIDDQVRPLRQDLDALKDARRPRSPLGAIVGSVVAWWSR